MSSNAPKVSFSVQSKSTSKSKLRPSRSYHHVHGDQDDEDQPTKQFVTEFDPNKTLTDSKPKPRLIIPPKSDESRPHKKMKNINSLNDASDQLQLELHSKTDGADADDKITYGLNLRKSVGDKDQEQLGVSVSTTLEPMEKTKVKDFKFEMDRLPEDEGLKQFEDVPVEGFGAALLTGLGWYEGRGIGKNPKGNVQVKQFEKKSFVSDDVNIKLMSSKDRDRDESKGGDKKDKEVKYRNRESESRASNNSRRKDRSKESEKRDSNGHKERDSWLRSNIRVRIVSKEIKKGGLYLKKGKVVDVVGPTTCDICMDESGELIQGVDQDLLETALPRRGGPVLVLYGRHKGVYGYLEARDLDKGTGLVRDADTQEVIKVKLEQIAEYLEDPSYIGH